MVVLSVAVCTKSGKPLVSRQFVEMPQARVEGLIAQFVKLDSASASDAHGGAEKQHTFVETDTVRYLYQPLEDLFLVMATSKSSNIIEDLDTLHIFAKLVSTYCRQLNEREVLDNFLDLVIAFDQAITPLGYKEKVTLGQIKSFVEMDSHEEKMHEIEMEARKREVAKVARQKANTLKAQRDDQERAERSMRSGRPGGSSSSSSSSSSMPSMASPAPAAAQADAYVVKKQASPEPAAHSGAGGLVLGRKPAQAQIMEQIVREDKGFQQAPAAAPAARQPEAPAAPEVPREAVHVVVEEHVAITALNDGTVSMMRVKGELAVHVGSPDAARAAIILGSQRSTQYTWQVHPQCDKARWGSESTLVPKDPSRPLPVGAATTVLKWSSVPREDAAVPVSINCWPSAAAHGMTVNLEYSFSEAAGLPELQDLAVTVPLPAGDVPEVGQVDGDYRLEPGALVWRVPRVSATSSSGTVEFASHDATTASVFFPISVSFVSENCLSGVQVNTVTVDGNTVPFSKEVRVIVDQYTIEAARQ